MVQEGRRPRRRGGELNLGAMLMLGRGGAVDEAAALALYRRAAAQGSATAEANIAGVYWVGTAGVPKDRTEAVKHYLVAAKGGNVVAERMLSVAYGTGDGIEHDENQQMAWARKAADAGDATSQNTVGYLILTGVGGTYDYVEAAMWLTLALERAGNSGELHDLATENLHTAMAQLNPQEQEEVARRVAHWREVNGGACRRTGRRDRSSLGWSRFGMRGPKLTRQHAARPVSQSPVVVSIRARTGECPAG